MSDGIIYKINGIRITIFFMKSKTRQGVFVNVHPLNHVFFLKFRTTFVL